MSKNKKEISLDKFKNIIKPNEELSFGIKSPIPSITAPPETIFIAWHGSFGKLGNIMANMHGTYYVCRSDDSHWNFDVYSVLPNKDSTVLNIIKSQQPYHTVKEGYQYIPELFRKDMQEELKKKIILLSLINLLKKLKK